MRGFVRPFDGRSVSKPPAVMGPAGRKVAMAPDPENHRARRVAAGAIVLSAVFSVTSTFPTTVSAQNRTGKGASAKTPSVIIDLGVLQELGGSASVNGPQGKPSVRAPVLRAPRKRPGAPPPLYLPPRSANERVAKASGTSPKRSAAKKATAKTTAAASMKAPAPRAKPPVSEPAKSVKTTPKEPARVAAAKKPVKQAEDKPVKDRSAEIVEAVEVQPSPDERKKSVAAEPPERKTAMADTGHMNTAEPSPAALPAMAPAKAAPTPEETPEETPARPAEQASETKDPAPSRAMTTGNDSGAQTQVAARTDAKPAVTNKSTAAPDPSAETAAPPQSAMTPPATMGDPVDTGEISTPEAAKSSSEAADASPAEKTPTDKLKGWMAALTNRLPAAVVVPDSGVKSEAAATAKAEVAKPEQAAPKAAPEKAQAAPVQAAPVMEKAVVQIARAEPEPAPAREEPAENRPRFDDPVRLVFSGDEAQLDDEARKKVQPLVAHLKADTLLRLRLLSYADGNNRSEREARQLSLFRALAVRSHLIRKGVSSARIEVRPQGSNTTRNPRDRVDLVLSSR